MKNPASSYRFQAIFIFLSTSESGNHILWFSFIYLSTSKYKITYKGLGGKHFLEDI